MAENEGATSSTNTDSGTSQDAGNANQGAQSTNTEPTPSGTLTQAQVDAIVKDRLAREREKYKGFDDLKKKAEEFERLQASQMSEAERLKAELDKAKESATGAEARMRKALTSAAIISEASKQGAKDPSLLVKLIDSDSLEITDDGDVKGAEEAVTALLASHDYLKGNGFTASGDGGQRTSAGLPTFTRDQIADPSFFREHKDEILLAQRQGRITT